MEICDIYEYQNRTHPGRYLPAGVLLFGGLLLLAATLWGVQESRNLTDTRIRKALVRQAVSIASALPIEDVQALSFTSEDKDRLEYLYLSQSLRAYAQNAGLRSIYTLSRMDETTLAFGPESMKRDDIFASAPGEIYQQPQPENFAIFDSATPFVTGPYTDEFGSFVSAFAPVIHPHSGQVLAVLGVDLEKEKWQASLRRAQGLPVLLITLPLGFLAFIVMLGFFRSPPSPNNKEAPNHLIPALFALAMLLLTAGTTWLFYITERIARDETFHTTALLKAETYANRLKALQNDISGLTAFFDSSGHIDHEEFKRFCAQTFSDNPIESVVWSPRVPPSVLEEIEQEKDPKQPTEPPPPPGSGSEKGRAYSVQYIFEITGPGPEPGYNIYSNPRQRTAINTAIHSGRATASKALLQTGPAEQAKELLIFQPVTTPGQQGILSISLQPERMMERFGRHSAAISSGLTGYLFEITADQDPVLLAGSGDPSTLNVLSGQGNENLRRRFPVHIFGRSYMLTFEPNALWYQTNTLQNWKFVLITGISLTGLLTGLIIMLINRPALLEKHVRARTTELHRSEQRFRDLINSIPDLVWLKDPEGHFLNCNRRFEEFLDKKEAHIIGKTDYDFMEAPVADAFRLHDQTAIKNRRPTKNEEWVQFASDGHRELLETVKTPLFDEKDHLIGTIGISRDITERKNTEKALRENEEKLRHIIENSTNMFYSHNPEGTLTYVSPQVKNILGYERKEAHRKWQELISDHPENDIAHQNTEKAIKTGKAQPTYEIELIHKQGHLVWAEVREAPVIKNGKNVAIVGSLTDITARKQAEEELKHSRRLLEQVINANPDLLWMKNPDGTFLMCNTQFEKLVGVTQDQLIGKTDYDFFPSDQADNCTQQDQHAIRKKATTTYQEFLRHAGKNANVCYETIKTPVFDQGNQPIGVLGIGRDITERVKLETALRQAQKLDSIGQLAGGVAHDFNNMLMGIMGYIELSRPQISPNHPVRENLDEMYRISQRSADLTRKLLGFARKQITAPRELNLNDTIHGMLNMLRRLIGEDIELMWEPGEKLWSVSMDPSQIDQILVNLCVNARDAIKGVGRIRISTSNKRLDEESCSLLPDAKPGDYILLKVTDTGKGLAPDTLDRIFEPFFTTKDIGEGTGLGLSTVHGIIKQNSGHIQVQSREGDGSTFFIYIPRLLSKNEIHEGREPMSKIEKGTETLLLVEDDHSILDTTTLILKNQGYHVLAASSPLKALELVNQHAGKIDLLITDVVMPGMSGPDLAKQLMTQDPNLKCIFMSGYTAEFMTPEDIENPQTAFLPKPFNGTVLNHAVRILLDSPPVINSGPKNSG